MRAYQALFNDIPTPPDSVQTMLLTGGSSGQIMDWPSTLAQIARFTGYTTLGAGLTIFANLTAVGATVPTSGSSITTGTSANSTGNNIPVIAGSPREFLIPAGSTGFAVSALTSGYAVVETWKR